MVKLLDNVVQEDDSIVESWYLLCYSFVKLAKFQNANQCLKNIQNLIQKQKITNDEFLSATAELEHTIIKEIGP